ncbi:MAG: MATE family efflux transporter [Acidimicrobiales bacterium]|jgi:putative MATE family efflux protein
MASETRPEHRRLRDLDRRIVALALPALGALLVEPIYNLTDSAIVGHLGRDPLAALAIAGGALNIVGWTAAFLEMATVSMVSFRRGAGDDAGAMRAAGAAYTLSGSLGFVVAGLVFVASPYLAEVLGAHGIVASEAVTYLRIAAVGLVPLLVSLAGNGHLTGLADTKRPFLIAVVANGVNLALEMLLVYGLHLGIAGSAWGTVAAQVVSACLFIVASRRAALRPARPRLPELRRLTADGLRLTVRTVALGLALLLSTAVAARLGTSVLAGHQIAMQMWLLLALTLDSLAVPAQVFVSEALGRADVAEAREVGQRTLRFGLACGIALGLLVIALAWVLPLIFSSIPEVQHQATRALIVCGAQQPLAALAFVLDGLLLGASDYRTLQRAMTAALVVFVPLAAVILRDHRIGITGIWVALACWLSVRVIGLGWSWARGNWSVARVS